MSELIEKDVICTILRDRVLLEEIAPRLPAKSISSPHLRWIYRNLLQYVRDYSDLPTITFFKNELKKDSALDSEDKERYIKLTRKLFKHSISKGMKKYAVDELRRFANKREMASIIENSINRLEKDDVEGAMNALAATSRIKSHEQDFKVSMWVDGWKERQKARKRRKEHPEEMNVIPFPWEALNQAVGGIQPGEVGTIASLAGRGKSISLMLCGVEAFMAGKNVVHVTLENSIWQTEQRYDAGMLGVNYNMLKGYKFSKAERKALNNQVKEIKKLLGDRLRIVKMTARKANIYTIERALTQFDRDGFECEYLVVDYADIMAPSDKQEMYRLDQTQVYWDLKTIADARGIPVMSATQVSKEYDKKKAYAEGLAEAYDKARILDIILTLNQFDKNSSDLLLMVAKNRDGQAGQEISLVAEYSHMQLVEK